MPKPKKTKKKVEQEQVEEVVEMSEEELQQELTALLEQAMGQQQEESDLRVAQLYGEVEEKMAADLISAFLILRESGKHKVFEEDKEEPTIAYKPFELIISTPGGTAVDMFSIYDMMRQTQEDCEIHTYGLGRVMSAGVVLLAAGTKGKRKIGANCRVMIQVL